METGSTDFSVLKKLFPSKTIPITDSGSVVITPIPLSKIRDVIEVLAPLLNPKNLQLTHKELGEYVGKHILNIIPFCTETQLSEIPFYALPDIVDAIIEMNFPDGSLKKWASLIEKIQKMGGTIKGLKKQ